MSQFKAEAYWEDRLRSQYDLKGVGDIGLSRSYNASLYDVRRHVFRRCLRRLSLDPAHTHVLDVGSGTGVYIDEWTRWGAASVTGIDLTPTAVESLARRYPSARFYQADIGNPQQTQVIGRDFDAVSVFDVLFHIMNDDAYRQALQNISSLLRPGGWLLYSDNLVPQEVRITHYVSRTESFILDALHAAGFVVFARMPMFVLMNDPTRTRSRLLRAWYRRLYRLAGHSELFGRIIGSALVPLELALTRTVKSAPGTELLICRKPTGN